MRVVNQTAGQKTSPGIGEISDFIKKRQSIPVIAIPSEPEHRARKIEVVPPRPRIQKMQLRPRSIHFTDKEFHLPYPNRARKIIAVSQ